MGTTTVRAAYLQAKTYYAIGRFPGEITTAQARPLRRLRPRLPGRPVPTSTPRWSS